MAKKMFDCCVHLVKNAFQFLSSQNSNLNKPQRSVFETTEPWIDFAVEGLIKTRASESNLAVPGCSAAEKVRTWTCFVR